MRAWLTLDEALEELMGGAAKWKWADQIAEWERFRQDAFQFAVDNGYDHPAFTDWAWHGVRDAGGDNKYD